MTTEERIEYLQEENRRANERISELDEKLLIQNKKINELTEEINFLQRRSRGVSSISK
jgi:peptidoglycan hydrolase CwlO-like protein